MIAASLLYASLLAQQAPPAAGVAGGPSTILEQYREARAHVGRDPDSQVELALWCEQRGLTSERLKHLTLAVLLQPDHAAARGLLGQVAHEGRWKRPEDVRAAEAADADGQATMREYLDRRSRAADDADSQQRLAGWCEENGLAEQAAAHYRAVLRHAPSREVAWKKLGYQKKGRVWVRPADFAAARAEAEAQREADKAWRPLLEKLRADLGAKDSDKRRAAEAALAAIEDPRAVPMIVSVLIRDDPGLQGRAAETLARIDGAGASQALASLAVFSDFADVRGRAVDLLERRDPRDFVGPLLDLIHKPFRLALNPEVGPESQGQLFAEGESYNVERIYRFDAWSELASIPRRIYTSDVPMLGGMDPRFAAVILNNGAAAPGVALASPQPASIPGLSGLSVQPSAGAAQAGANLVADTQMFALRRDAEIIVAMAAFQEKLGRMREQMQRDATSIEILNRRIREIDDRVLPLVKATTGQDFGDDQHAWKSWWSDQLGVVYESKTSVEKPTYTEFVWASTGSTHHACFVAGTPVHTIGGLAPIESLEVGDRVLSQDVETGRLSYQAVVAVHRNPPTETLKLDIGGEPLVATGIHRFWRPGKGWTMARDLEPGDAVRTIGGTRPVIAVEPAGSAPVYNLEVAENRDFFVGEAGALVYDYSLVQPVAAAFDAPARPADKAR